MRWPLSVIALSASLASLFAFPAAPLTRVAAQSEGSSPIDFVRDVQPILRQNCYGCHGPTRQMNGLRLDRRRDAMRGGTIAVVAPGNAAASRLYLRLIGNQYGLQMPPTGPIDPAQVAVIKAWIDQGAVWPDAASGETPAPAADPATTRLIDALRAGDRRTAAAILEGNPAVVHRRGPGGSTPLMYAALYGRPDDLKRLLAAGADPNARNDAGATALMWAVPDLARTTLLLDHGADVNARSLDGRTPLLIAAGDRGAAPVVSLLLDRGANPSVTAPSLIAPTTPLTEAARAGDLAIIRLLLAHGADPKAAGPTALAFAFRVQCLLCFEALAQAAPPPVLTAALVLDAPPLGEAAHTRLLLERGASARATDPAGVPAMTLVAASDALPLDSAQALIDHGADIKARTAAGETALRIARQHGPTAIVDLLRRAGAEDDDPGDRGEPSPAPAASPRAAVLRSVPLLQRSDEEFLRKSGCVSCHNNSLTATTVATVRAQGLPVDETIARRSLRTVAAYLDNWRDRVLLGEGIPGNQDTISYLLVGLADEHYPATLTTDALARYVRLQQQPDGRWASFAHRPPLESGDIQVTALSLRAVQAYSPPTERADARDSVRRAAAWLAGAQAHSTDARAFQLLGLAWAGASRPAIATAAQALASTQRPDGGWSQWPTLPSDAYATGQALVALRQSGMRPSDPVFRRGVEFLLRTQLADGSWLVHTRARPIQPYFESGFPHGRDQFISIAATNWAATALALAGNGS